MTLSLTHYPRCLSFPFTLFHKKPSAHVRNIIFVPHDLIFISPSPKRNIFHMGITILLFFDHLSLLFIKGYIPPCFIPHPLTKSILHNGTFHHERQDSLHYQGLPPSINKVHFKRRKQNEIRVTENTSSSSLKAFSLILSVCNGLVSLVESNVFLLSVCNKHG